MIDFIHQTETWISTELLGTHLDEFECSFAYTVMGGLLQILSVSWSLHSHLYVKYLFMDQFAQRIGKGTGWNLSMYIDIAILDKSFRQLPRRKRRCQMLGTHIQHIYTSSTRSTYSKCIQLNIGITASKPFGDSRNTITSTRMGTMSMPRTFSLPSLECQSSPVLPIRWTSWHSIANAENEFPVFRCQILVCCSSW